jgi:hypothetical protein
MGQAYSVWCSRHGREASKDEAALYERVTA